MYAHVYGARNKADWLREKSDQILRRLKVSDVPMNAAMGKSFEVQSIELAGPSAAIARCTAIARPFSSPTGIIH